MLFQFNPCPISFSSVNLCRLASSGLNSGRPGGKIRSQRSKLEAAICGLDELSVSHTSLLIDVDDGITVVEGVGSLALDGERSCTFGNDLGVVFVQASGEGVGEVVAGGAGLDNGGGGVRGVDSTLARAAGDDGNAGCLHGGSGSDEGKS
jgi:hypothetical protein